MTEDEVLNLDQKMGLWNKVCKTNPDYTKKMTYGAKLIAINAQTQRKKATEMFGPFGIGWGVKEPSYRVLGIIEEAKKGIIMYEAILFYKWKDIEGEFPISSSIEMIVGSKLDDECIKKVTTDALTKGLSYLGFNSDIHEGLWDDDKYVNSLKEEFKCANNKKNKKPQPKSKTKSKSMQQDTHKSNNKKSFKTVVSDAVKLIGKDIVDTIINGCGFQSIDDIKLRDDQENLWMLLLDCDVNCPLMKKSDKKTVKFSYCNDNCHKDTKKTCDLLKKK